MFQTKVVEKIKSYILYSILFLNLAFYEILWENIVESDRPQMTIWRMCISCLIPKLQTRTQIGNTYYFSTATMVDSYDENHSSLLISVERVHT